MNGKAHQISSDDTFGVYEHLRIKYIVTLGLWWEKKSGEKKTRDDSNNVITIGMNYGIVSFWSWCKGRNTSEVDTKFSWKLGPIPWDFNPY